MRSAMFAIQLPNCRTVPGVLRASASSARISSTASALRSSAVIGCPMFSSIFAMSAWLCSRSSHASARSRTNALCLYSLDSVCTYSRGGNSTRSPLCSSSWKTVFWPSGPLGMPSRNRYALPSMMAPAREPGFSPGAICEMLSSTVNVSTGNPKDLVTVSIVWRSSASGIGVFGASCGSGVRYASPL